LPHREHLASEAAHRIYEETVGGPELSDGGAASITIALIENLREVAEEYVGYDGFFSGGCAPAVRPTTQF